MNLFLLITLPTFLEASIKIKMIIPKDESNPSIEISGSEKTTPLPKKDRIVYGISDEVLKDAIFKLFENRPNDVFLDDTTPWGDLHEKYKWTKLSRIILPVNSFITNTSRESVILSRKNFINNSEFKSVYNFTMKQIVQNSVQNIFDMEEKLITDQILFYITVLSPPEESTFDFYWDENSKKIIDFSIGLKYENELELEAGEQATVILTAEKTRIEAQVDYLSVLEGMVACNYAETVNGHHFFAYDINHLTHAAHLPGKVKSRQSIRVEVLNKPKLIIIDKTLKVSMKL